MKIAYFVFMMIGCAVLMHGTSYAAASDPVAQQGSSARPAGTASDRPRAVHAAPPDGGKHQAREKPSDEQPGNRRASLKNPPAGQTSLPKTNGTNQIPNRQEHSASKNAMDFHTPGTDKSGGAAKSGLVQNGTGNRALPVRSPNVVRPTVPSLSNVRHLSPNAAVIGGSANATTRNTGAINGTHMNRKP